MEDEDDVQTEGEYSSVFILDFFNEVLRRYAKKSTSRSISFQKYIAGSVLEVYGGIITNTTNPFIVKGYLALLSALLGVSHQISNKEMDREAPYFSTPLNKNLVLTRCVSTIATVMRQISTFLMQGNGLYIDMPTIALGKGFGKAAGAGAQGERQSGYEEAHAADDFYAAPSSGASTGDASLLVISQSILSLLRIAICLPDTTKVTLASGQLMNILFRELSKHSAVLYSRLFCPEARCAENFQLHQQQQLFFCCCLHWRARESWKVSRRS
jgi:hypothetical protein